MKKATVLNNLPFTIEPERVMREMRIPHKKELSEIEEKPVAEAIDKAIKAAYGLIEGKGVFKTYSLTGVDGDFVRGEEVGDVFEGKNMVKLLANCPFATLMACTIGPRLEAHVEELKNEGDVTGSFNLEMVGGWMADYMADRVDEHVVREIKKKGFERTMRFAPGYGNWVLEKQPEVLRLCEAEKIGITLSDTIIMEPRKSVSAVIGWRRAD